MTAISHFLSALFAPFIRLISPTPLAPLPVETQEKIEGLAARLTGSLERQAENRPVQPLVAVEIRQVHTLYPRLIKNSAMPCHRTDGQLKKVRAVTSKGGIKTFKVVEVDGRNVTLRNGRGGTFTRKLAA